MTLSQGRPTADPESQGRPTADPGVRNRLPDPGAGFVWEEHAHGCGTYPALHPQSPGAAAAFTTRLGGVSQPPLDALNVSLRLGDHPARVFCNRDLAGRTIGGSMAWTTVSQVHGGEVVRATRERRRDADALWTDDPDVTVAVLVADCVPVLMIGERGVAVVHAGWRGLAAGIVEEAARQVRGTAAFAGPAIGPCCFEVREDASGPLRERFGDVVMAGPRHADLWAAVESAARDAGLREVRSARLCTSCHPGLFFSHRRDLGETGRQALVARVDP